ncbi:hypothetical protein Plav_2153 [Parvibaculum lavamentivorans DS-1]|uniref:Uncharacterized protein n=1 Tax=Parvibaculum lavamentivorans (strain DS-1 / DSM 13023 / NCIMB 13966) TaxID=402881 RepID=A7HV34_PARL1|nr:hypothetical protein [Parvibaculum lavamentivorans]ABS63767.1 hypothetical protein Plav_2153 [Parvibaculum lavamentivorans DS-1]
METATLRDRLLWAVFFLCVVALFGLGRVELAQIEAQSVVRVTLGLPQTFFVFLLILWLALLLLSGAAREDEDVQWGSVVLFGVVGAALSIIPGFYLVFIAGEGGPFWFVPIAFLLIGLPAALAQFWLHPEFHGHRYKIALVHLATPMLYYLLALVEPKSAFLTSSPLGAFALSLAVVPYAAMLFVGATKRLLPSAGRVALLGAVLVWLPFSIALMPHHGPLKSIVWPVVAIVEHATPAEKQAALESLQGRLLAGDMVCVGDGYYRFRGVTYANVHPVLTTRLAECVRTANIALLARELGFRTAPPGAKVSLHLSGVPARRDTCLKQPERSICDRRFHLHDISGSFEIVRSSDSLAERAFASDAEVKAAIEAWLERSRVSERTVPSGLAKR